MNIEKAKELVYDLFSSNMPGHGVDHIKRVLSLSLKFAESEGADKDIATLIALLHDVDDYKLFGVQNSKDLTNARRIMSECDVSQDVQEMVCEGIRTIGYGKRLRGLTPSFIEAMVVSDADMCDALGASGIIRTHDYAVGHDEIFFDREIFPIDNISANQYNSKNADTCVCHFFEKLLNLKGLMLTSSGRSEAGKRHQFIIDFLYQFFEEENCPEWTKYLDEYLERQSQNGNDGNKEKKKIR